jgi:hypothetical protein
MDLLEFENAISFQAENLDAFQVVPTLSCFGLKMLICFKFKMDFLVENIDDKSN